MEDKPKSVKVNCSFCSKEIECPENMLNAEKHSCFECFQELSKKENVDIRKVHVDVPMDKFTEFVPETMTSSIVAEAFPEMWKERKEELKELSKKGLAEEMFGAGAYVAIKSFMQAMEEEAKKEKEMEDKGGNKDKEALS
jgi:hypothetical protein